MATATVSDVKERWASRESLPPDSTIDTLLTDAELVCLNALPDLLERIASDSSGHLERNLVYVECQLVLQVLTNPNGIRQMSQSSGPFSHSVTFGVETLHSGMVLTAQQLQLLGGGSRKAFSIDMTPPPRDASLGNSLLPKQIINYPEVP